MRIPALICFAGLTLSAPGQSILEHGAAAAGGGLGVLGGKPISDQIGKALDNTGKAASTSAAEKQPAADSNSDAAKQSAAAAAAIAGPGYRSADPQSVPARPTSRARQPRKPQAPREPEALDAVIAPVPVVAPAPVVVAVRPPVSLDAIRKIQPGAKRSSVLSQVGEPSSAVTIPDEGHLLEIFSYANGSEWVATLRLDNGVVVSRETAK